MSDSTAEEQQIGTPHPYHLVNPSAWPLLSAFAAGLLAVGLVLWMHDSGTAVLWLGLAAVLACMFGWWRDVIKESVVEKAHSPVTKIGMRYGMMLFIASEVMFFLAFFWAFFDASLFVDEVKQFARVEATGGIWPPEGIYVFDPFHLPFLMTMILLLSGCTITWAHHAILEGDNATASKGIGLTVLLGIVFSILQGYEYGHAYFGFTDGIYASTFYMLTGFHGLHVIIGTLFLIVVWWRTSAGHFTAKSHFGFEAAAWYWHFVDVVWLFVFAFIYWWGGYGGPVGH